MITGDVSQSTAAAAGTGAAAKLATDMTMFLKLLTTQMQNQDPLDPMDTSQYTQQLVQFSQVEQAVQQNTTLNAILTRLSGQDLIAASSLVGKTATFDSAVAGLSDTAPAAWSYQATRNASALVAKISDGDGNVIATQALSADSGTLYWDGTLADGGKAPAGSYTLAIEARDANGGEVPVTVAVRARIDEAMTDGSDVVLRANGAAYGFASLTGTAAQD